MAYTIQDAIAQLIKSSRRWSFEYRLFDNLGVYKQSLNVASCVITNNDLADIKRTLTLNLKDSDADSVNFSTDRLLPVVKLAMPDGSWYEWHMGLFLLSAPQRNRKSRTPQLLAVSGFDRGQVLRSDLVTDRYIVPQGSYYVDAVNSLLLSAGLPAGSIAGSGLQVATDLEYDAGTSKYVIINELLAALNYSSLSFDGDGVPYSGAYISPAVASSIYNYQTDQDSVVIPDDGFIETLDLYSVPNVFVCYVSTPDLDASGNAIILRSEYVNSNPSSPTSTVSIGRNIVSYVQLTNIADQATLDQATLGYAEGQSQVYSTVEFKTGLMPFHTTADVITIDTGDGNGPTKYRETQWSFDMRAGAQMDHLVRRVVQV